MSQSQVQNPIRRRIASRPIAISSGAGVVILLILAAVGAAGWVPALIGAGVIAILGGILHVLQSVEVVETPTGPSAPERSPSMDRAPPFAAILEHLLDPILLVAGGDRDDLIGRRFILANAAARELLRIQRSEGPLTTAVRAPEVLAAVDEALFEGVPGEALYEPGGVQGRVWRVHAVPLAKDAGANTRLALISLRDETEFRRSERTRADFLANASHELRTPLASLAGFIETLRGHARDDAQARERFLGIMHIQAERMRRLIDDLMSLSRIELGEHIPPSGEVDIALAVIDVLDSLGPIATERRVTFDQALPPIGEALITGDRDQILQVVQNLAENALKYTPRDGAVSVEVLVGLDAQAAASPMSFTAAHLSLLTPDHAYGERYVAVRVSDTGPGIARTHLPRLTERFYRVEGQKSGEHSGTGLGLAIVKHIINRHRGGLAVESVEGRGATFTAYMPMTRNASARSRSSPMP
jgi:two-component system phosphate regulon sensor histidine kinase PhoR